MATEPQNNRERFLKNTETYTYAVKVLTRILFFLFVLFVAYKYIVEGDFGISAWLDQPISNLKILHLILIIWFISFMTSD